MFTLSVQVAASAVDSMTPQSKAKKGRRSKVNNFGALQAAAVQASSMSPGDGTLSPLITPGLDNSVIS